MPIGLDGAGLPEFLGHTLRRLNPSPIAREGQIELLQYIDLRGVLLDEAPAPFRAEFFGVLQHPSVMLVAQARPHSAGMILVRGLIAHWSAHAMPSGTHELRRLDEHFANVLVA